MDDGAAAQSGFYLHTKSFTFAEVYMLAYFRSLIENLLHYRFGLFCTVQNHKGQPVINITAKSIPLFVSIVKPHFHKTMYYKLTKDTLS